MARADGRIVFEIMADDDGFKKKLGGLRGEVKGGVSAMTVAVGNLISDVVKKGASAAADLVKSTVGAYAQYEQMVGGVDKLFGKASGKLQRYAANAYKTSGLSANKYMEQATSFSASMVSSLGGDVSKAADMTDLAMRSMADNVNVFGSNMTDVQNAFQGFAKQNYTMLDNLKLGYGGTKEEMQRLIRDAAGMTSEQKKLGVTVDANSMSFSNITAAIAVMQEHMGIAGTTTKEAAGTIEGSVGMMKASWENFLTALGSGEGIGDATDQLLESVGYVVKNVGERVLEIGDNLVREAPELVGKAAAAVTDSLPDLYNHVVAGLETFPLGQDINDFVTGAMREVSIEDPFHDLKESAAELAQSGQIVNQEFGATSDTFHDVGTAVGGIISAVVEFTADIGKGLAEVVASKDAAYVIDALKKSWDRFSKAVKPFVKTVLMPFGKAIGHVMGDALVVVGALVSGSLDLISDIMGAVTELVRFLSGKPNAITGFFKGVGPFFSSMWNGVKSVATSVWNGVTSFIGGIPGKITGFFRNVGSFFSGLWNGVRSATMSAWNAVTGFIGGIPGRVTGFFGGVGSFFSGLWNGVRSATMSAWNAVTGFIGGIPGRVTGFFGGVGSFFSGLWNGVRSTTTSVLNGVVSFVAGIPGRILGFFASLPGRFSSVFSGVGNAIRNAFNAAASAVASVPGRIVGFFSGIVGRIGGAVSGVTSALSRPFTAAWSAISGIPGRIRSAFNGLRIRIPHFSLPHVSVSWSGKPFKIPHFSVSWHAMGAVIDGPMLFSDAMGGVHGMGERGGEAMIQPLEGAIGRRWADFVAQRVVASQGGDAVVAWLDRNLKDTIAEGAPTATPREFNRMVRGAMA